MVPHDESPRGVYLKDLDEDWSFAFNFASPSGVVLLSRHGKKRLETLLSEYPTSKSPSDLLSSETIDNLLCKAGLLNSISDQNAAQPNDNTSKKTLNIWLHVVNTCNFKCSYCYIPELGHRLEPVTLERLSIKADSIFPIISQISGYCASNKISHLHIKFAGGEPTLRIDLIDKFCSEAKRLITEMPVTFGMITNGSFNTSELIPVLLKHRISVSFSIDGYKDSHDAIRYSVNLGKKVGSWNTITGNVEALRQSGVKSYFLFTVTESNYLDLEAFAEYSHSRAIGFRLSLVRQDTPPSQKFSTDLSASLKQFYAKLGRNMPLNLRIERDAKFAEWNLKKRKQSACGSCQNYFSIDHKGSLSSCQMTMNRPGGNLKTESFSTIVERLRNEPKNAFLARPELRDGACSRCRFFFVCSGGCPQHTFQVFNSFNVPSAWCMVFGDLVPVYLEAVATHMLRRYRSNVG